LVDKELGPVLITRARVRYYDSSHPGILTIHDTGKFCTA
jgi:hypothetical protein